MHTGRDPDMPLPLMAELNALGSLCVDFVLAIINRIICRKRQIAVSASVPAVTDRRRIMAALCLDRATGDNNVAAFAAVIEITVLLGACADRCAAG